MPSKVQLLILFLIIKSIYVPLNRRKSRYYWKIPLDDRLPLIPWFIIPYLSYFIFITLTFILLWNSSYIRPLFYSSILSYIIACIFWYLFPNGVKRPTISSKTIFDKITNFIYKIDDDSNALPSAHVFVTMICSYYLSLKFSSAIPVIGIVALLIILSTLFTKQHYILDIVGGIGVFLISIVLPKMLAI